MAIRDLALLGTGLLLAGLGLGALLFAGGEEPTVSSPAAVIPPDRVETIGSTSAPIEISGVGDAVTRVLERNGSAGMADRADLDLSLPVLRVLRENGVVLTVTAAGDHDAARAAR